MLGTRGLGTALLAARRTPRRRQSVYLSVFVTEECPRSVCIAWNVREPRHGRVADRLRKVSAGRVVGPAPKLLPPVWAAERTAPTQPRRAPEPQRIALVAGGADIRGGTMRAR